MDKDFTNPHQHTIKVGFKKKCDYYEQRMLKYPHRCQFHSYPEFIHAALLEADPEVTYFVPQPFCFQVGIRRYTPDCYFIKAGRPHLVEIKPQKSPLRADVADPIKSLCNLHDVKWCEVTNESILQEEIKGRNWLTILRYLLSWKPFTSHFQEEHLYAALLADQSMSIDELRSLTYQHFKEHFHLALFRLCHRGKCHLEVDKQPLSGETRATIT